MLEAFHFIRPQWLIAIPFIALLLLVSLKRSNKKSGWEAICDPALLQYQLSQQSQKQTKSSHVLSWTVPLVFLIALFALAGPTWEKKEQPVFQQGNALVIILDLSLSMNAKDVKPSRLERAKLKLIDILKQKKEGQTALIAFAGDAHTVSPLTIDNKTIMSLLPALDSSIMPLTGSHLIDALDTAKQLLKNAGFAHGDILLISDGVDSSQQRALEKNIKKLRRQGYRFSVIGVGTQAGSPIPILGQGGFIKDQSGQVVLSKLSPASLKKLASIGDGSYHKLSLDDSDFQAILNQQIDQNNNLIDQDKQLEQWVDAGAYFTLLLIPLALLSFRKGLFSLVFCLSILSPFMTESTYAKESGTEPKVMPSDTNNQLKNVWKNLWSTQNQQAQRSFDAKDYQTAAEHFSNQSWKASANYRSGNFEQALEQYSRSDNISSLYNKGNTLANMNKLPEAIKAYEETLKKLSEPDQNTAESVVHKNKQKNKQIIKENTTKNLDYLKELLAQQQKQSSEQDSNEKNDDSEKQSENQEQEQQNSSDDASKSNESDSDESEQNESENSQSEGADSGEKEKDSSDSENESDTQEQDEQNESDEPTEPDSREPDLPKEAKATEEQKEENPDDESKQQTQSEPVEDDQNKQENAENTQNDVLSQLSQEEQQSLKQWLQRIPDNPGELLRVKFRNNTLLKQRKSDSTDTRYEGNPW